MQDQKALVQLLSLYASVDNEEKSTYRFLSTTFDRRFIEKKKKNSLSFGQSPGFLNKEPGKREFTEVFLGACNRMKRAQAGTIYASMNKNPLMKKDADMFFKMYHLRLKTELTLTDFLDAACKIINIRKLSINQKHLEIHRKKTRISSFDIASHSLLPYDVLVRLFHKYDRNGDGFIDLEELKFALKEVMTKKGIEDIFSTSDNDHNKLLDLEEFLRLFQRSPSNV